MPAVADDGADHPARPRDFSITSKSITAQQGCRFRDALFNTSPFRPRLGPSLCRDAAGRQLLDCADDIRPYKSILRLRLIERDCRFRSTRSQIIVAHL